MPKKTGYSEKSLIVVGTHADDDIERATMTFACAGAAAALGVKTTVFLTVDGVKLAQKGFAAKMRKVEGMASISDLIDAFVGAGGRIQACVPCADSRGIDRKSFLPGVELVNLMDFASAMIEADKVYSC
jgi:uncharacterized protein involved in oxidation of intracellular sulfur